MHIPTNSWLTQILKDNEALWKGTGIQYPPRFYEK